jgi:hypothetical protein
MSVTIPLLFKQGRELSVTKKRRYTGGQELSVTRAPIVSCAVVLCGSEHYIGDYNVTVHITGTGGAVCKGATPSVEQ